jgi:hypothetical protein
MSSTRSVVSNECYNLQMTRGIGTLPEWSILCKDLLQAVRVSNRGYIPAETKIFIPPKIPDVPRTSTA